MYKLKSYLILATTGLLLSACQGDNGFVVASQSAEVTDKNISPQNPHKIEKSQVVLGFLSLENAHVEYNKIDSKYTLKGHSVLVNSQGATLSANDILLSGKLSGNGDATLYPENDSGSEKVRARITCLEKVNDNSCKNVILDFYVKKDSQIFATQLLVELDNVNGTSGNTAKPEPTKPQEPKKPETPKPSAPVTPSNPVTEADDEIKNAPEEEDETPGLFVGTLYDEPDTLFTEPNNGTNKPPVKPNAQTTPPVPGKSPVPQPPKDNGSGSQQGDRARDQAIGLPYKGTLENATNFKEIVDGNNKLPIDLKNTFRGRHYGTYELVQSILSVATYQHKITDGDILVVGDLSQKNGGKLAFSNHKSHQNGLDVDIAYPLKDDHTPGFNSVLDRNGKVSDNMRLTETFRIFEYTHVTLNALDRIFVDGRIKKALCDYSRQNGMLDEKDEGRAREVLRRLRAEDGHKDHYHLRIKCSAQQPRCRMISEPEAGSGCPLPKKKT